MTKIAVRDGQLVIPACPNCLCRLNKKNNDLYEHFRKWAWWIDKDARGCRCSLVGETFAVMNGIPVVVYL